MPLSLLNFLHSDVYVWEWDRGKRKFKTLNSSREPPCSHLVEAVDGLVAAGNSVVG